MKPKLPLLLIAILTTGISIAYAGEYFDGGGYGGVSGIAEREKIRRQQRMEEAIDSYLRGNEAMKNDDCETAYNHLTDSVEKLPIAPLTASLRATVVELYAQAAVCIARKRAETGLFDEARTILLTVISEDYLPGYLPALNLLKNLDNPDAFNQAITPKHVENVAKVDKALKLGRAYYDLGDYDAAEKEFHRVLLIDKTNSAARRLLGLVASARSKYYNDAYLQTRTTLLAQVEQAWELPVPLLDINRGGEGTDGKSQQIDLRANIKEKLNRIIIPKVDFNGITVKEAISFLKLKAKALDNTTNDPLKKGVNFVLQPNSNARVTGGNSDEQGIDILDGGSDSFEAIDSYGDTIDLNLDNVPLGEVLHFITAQTGLTYRIESYAVVISSNESTGSVYSKTFSVPPAFFSLSDSVEADSADGGDIFSDPLSGGDDGASSARKKFGLRSAKDVLRDYGIKLDDETGTAHYIRSSSQLVVKTNQKQMAEIEKLLFDFQRTSTNNQIKIVTKFVDVSQENVNELGFDWLIGPFNIASSSRVFGGGGTVGNQLSGISGQDFTFVPPQLASTDGTLVPTGANPLTAGLRSGSRAISADSVDSLINGTPNAATSNAPGIFSLAGVFTDPEFQVIIRALNQKKGVDVLTAPSIVTKSGKQALIQVIREFRYPTEYDPPEIPTNFGGSGGQIGGNVGTASVSSFPVTPATPTAFEKQNLGVSLDVQPQINSDQYTIDLQLKPQIVEFEGFINYGSPIQSGGTNALGQPVTITLTDNKIEQPVFSMRTIDTDVSVYDGSTLVLGGLMREEVESVNDKVPLLGDLPLVGRLFQSKVEKRFKSNIVIFVSAQIIDPAGNPVNQSSGNASDVQQEVFSDYDPGYISDGLPSISGAAEADLIQ